MSSLRRAVDILNSDPEPDRGMLALCLTGLAAVLHAIGRSAEAETPARWAVIAHALHQHNGGRSEHPLGMYLNYYGSVLDALGRTRSQIAAAFAEVEAEARAAANDSATRPGAAR